EWPGAGAPSHAPWSIGPMQGRVRMRVMRQCTRPVVADHAPYLRAIVEAIVRYRCREAPESQAEQAPYAAARAGRTVAPALPAGCHRGALALRATRSALCAGQGRGHPFRTHRQPRGTGAL